MRIIGGIAGGRLLTVPKGFGVRPTPDLVRQAIFNSLGARVEQAQVLDLFSGSGALGLECLSRGAGRVVSVEKTNRHALMIRQNLIEAGLPVDRFDLRIQDVFAAVAQLRQQEERFDLILADPPYGEKNVGRRSVSYSQKLIDLEELPHLLSPGGLFVLGHTKRDTLELQAWWEEARLLRHGDSIMRILRGRE